MLHFVRPAGILLEILRQVSWCVDAEEPLMCRLCMPCFIFLLKSRMSEMGRKVKISFSSSDKDSALSYLHDLDLFQNCKW
jgi:hypothetical protein